MEKEKVRVLKVREDDVRRIWRECNRGGCPAGTKVHVHWKIPRWTRGGDTFVMTGVRTLFPEEECWCWKEQAPYQFHTEHPVQWGKSFDEIVEEMKDELELSQLEMVRTPTVEWKTLLREAPTLVLLLGDLEREMEEGKVKKEILVELMFQLINLAQDGWLGQEAKDDLDDYISQIVE